MTQGYDIKIRHLPPGQNCPDPWLKIDVLGITVHSTGTLELGKASDTDEFNEWYFHKNKLDASAHLFADYDSITELLPWQKGKAVRAWHAGPKAARFISVELCEQKDRDRHMEAYKRTIWLTATACYQYGWDPMEKITVEGRQLYRVHSHLDISRLLGGTNHRDPDHYLPVHGQSMDGVRKDVVSALAVLKEADMVRTFTDVQGHWAQQDIEKCANTKTPGGVYLLNGRPDGTFDPNGMMTRAELSVFASRLMSLLGK
jgi:N-acetylmuramoyl-L-alanine amidase CwlA